LSSFAGFGNLSAVMPSFDCCSCFYFNLLKSSEVGTIGFDCSFRGVGGLAFEEELNGTAGLFVLSVKLLGLPPEWETRVKS
jgi:hypothetical protein